MRGLLHRDRGACRNLGAPHARLMVAGLAAVAVLVPIGAAHGAHAASGALASGDAVHTPATGSVVAHQLNVADAGFGTARLRERQSGARWRSTERDAAGGRFSLGLEYAYTHYAFAGLASRDRDQHHLHVPLRWQSATWQVELRPLVATSSNVFQDPVGRGTSDDLDLYARALWRSSAAGTGWALGVARDAAFGRPRLYPLLAMTWHTPQLDAVLGAPASHVRWQWREGLAVGAAVYPDGAHWHVVSDERGGAAFDFSARTWRAALTAEWQARRWLGLRLEAGSSFARRYTFEDDTGAAIRRSADSAPFARLDLVLRF